VTGLPNNPLGRLAANGLRMAGVDLGGIVWDDNHRMGVYYVEFAGPPRPIQVTYDRANSCTAHLSVDHIDWSYILNTRLVHLTGITVALSTSCWSLVDEIITRAKAEGVAVSFDVNYRSKLWTAETAAATLRPMMQGVDLLFCKRADAQKLFGCTGTPEQVIQQMAEMSGARHVIVTLGEQGVLGWDGVHVLHEPAVPVQIIDRLGAGDALAAGVLHGWLAGNFAQGLRNGVVLAALALSQRGDIVVTNPQELDTLLKNLNKGEGLVR
jgi:2-dehydro-3-deoxygluconokinase